MRLSVTDPLEDLLAGHGLRPADLPAGVSAVPATRDEALVRAASIREGIERFAREVLPQIGEAFLRRDWVALGYHSWESYVRREFRLDRVRLPRADRQDAAVALRVLGMSTRAIAASLGADQKTVRNDLDAAASAGVDVAPAAVAGADGKQYAPARPVVEPVVQELAPVVDQPVVPPASVPGRAPEPVPPAPAAAIELESVVDPGVELLAGRVRIRVRAQRRADGGPAVFVRLTSTDRTLGEEWSAGDNEDALQLATALVGEDLDALIDALVDARSALRAGVV